MSLKNTLLVVALTTLFGASVNAAEKQSKDLGLTKALQPLIALQQELEKIEADERDGKITFLQAAIRLKELNRLIEAATK